MSSKSSVSVSGSLFIVVLSITVPVNCDNIITEQQFNSRQNGQQVAMFVFGDSLYDPGNNNKLNISFSDKANHWPYGETFFNYPTGRYCDGRLIPDFIATYAKLPMWKPFDSTLVVNFTIGANFASGGSGALPLSSTGSIDLTQQLNFFKEVAYQMRVELGEVEANNIISEAVYLNSVGGNDYATFVKDNPDNITESDQRYFVIMVMDSLIAAMKEIYEMGGRKFMFQNVGPMGCLPGTKQEYGLLGGQCKEELQSIIKLHNKELVKALEALESQLQGFKYSLFDYYTSLYDMVQNPCKYEFREADVACCGNGTYRGSNCGVEPYELCSNASEYVFFDGSHPGDRVNSILAQLLWSGDSAVVVPCNFKDLYDLDPENVIDHSDH